MKYAWLCHPVTVVAVIVLLVNDHVLKQTWPGFLTGKLSDVAGLVVAPPLLALLLRRRADLAAVLLTGAVFAVVKCTETGAEVASQVWTLAAGPSRVLADPTDLLALPALALAWWVREHADTVPTRTRIAFAIPLAVLAVTATSAAPPVPAAEDVRIEGKTIVAIVGGSESDNVSLDGGSTWSARRGEARGPDRSAASRREVPGQSAACVPGQAQRCYRIVKDRMKVEQSDDGGVTWRPSWEVPSGRVALLERALAPEPFDLLGRATYDPVRPVTSVALAVQDRPGGQHVVVVANGLDGVAVRNPAGTWRRLGFSKAGGLSEADATPLDRFGVHVGDETTVAVLAGLGAFALALGVRKPRRAVAVTVACTLAACGCATLLPLGTGVGTWALLTGVLGMMTVAVTLIVLLAITGAAGLTARQLTVASGAGVFTALGVALPFHGWSAGWPDDYGTAVGLAVLLGLAAATAGCVTALRVGKPSRRASSSRSTAATRTDHAV
ncbi:hypothetical protein ACFXJ8_12255 [Nonomuraea sp. NPDC059194]|uniref:hypothetical protein n=1 Tax=Nonomuraea sp. NPDC059194 TaxID=3346764 RepID=UPI00369DF4CB